jgi:membrane protein implicated in regulation of membrane protease activity
MRLEWLFQWWNAVYSVPLAFVLLFLTVSSVVGLVGGMFEGIAHGHGHADSDLDADVDVDLDADVDVDVDADLDLDAEPDVPTHAHSGSGAHAHRHADAGPFLTMLAFIGVGKAPFMLTVQVLLLLWGLIGIGLHQLTAAAGPLALLWSVPVTLTLSLVGTRAFATAFARTFRSFELPGVKRNDLVGRTGQVVYSVNAEEGTVHVRDPHGALQRIRARCAHGCLEPGRQIIVLGYDPQQSLYEVDDVTEFVDRQ